MTFWQLNAKLSNNLRQMNFTKDSLADVTGGYGHYTHDVIVTITKNQVRIISVLLLSAIFV